MTSRREPIDIPFKTPVPVLVDNSFSMFTYSSYSRQRHLQICMASNYVDKSLICERQETNEYDKNVVSITFHDCISKKNVFGHVPFNWGKLAAKFLQFSQIIEFALL